MRGNRVDPEAKAQSDTSRAWCDPPTTDPRLDEFRSSVSVGRSYSSIRRLRLQLPRRRPTAPKSQQRPFRSAQSRTAIACSWLRSPACNPHICRSWVSCPASPRASEGSMLGSIWLADPLDDCGGVVEIGHGVFCRSWAFACACSSATISSRRPTSRHPAHRGQAPGKMALTRSFGDPLASTVVECGSARRR